MKNDAPSSDSGDAEKGPSPDVLAFFDEAPVTHQFWVDLNILLYGKIEDILKRYRHRWSGNTAPGHHEVFCDAYTGIFVTGNRTWRPQDRNQPQKGKLSEGLIGRSIGWTPSMWSLYRYLTEKIIYPPGSKKRISVLESVVLNLATPHSNSMNSLTMDVTITASHNDDESLDSTEDTQEKNLEKAKTKSRQKRNTDYTAPWRPVIPDKKAVSEDEWRALQRCITASDYEDKKFLMAVFKWIWEWRPVRDRDDSKQDEDIWKTKDCASEIASQFPGQTVEEITARIYKATARHLRPIVIEYEIERFFDSIPPELQGYARFYRESQKLSIGEILEKFSKQSGKPVNKVAAMHLEFEKFRDEWGTNPLSELIKKQLGGISNTTEQE